MPAARRALLPCLFGLVIALTSTSEAKAATPAPAPTPSSPVFGVHPRLQNETTLSKGHFKFDLTAGGSVSDAVTVQNFSDATLVIHVYAADLVQTSGGGGLAPTQEDTVLTGVGSWMHVDSETFTLPPHKQLDDGFTMKVPLTATPGDQGGAIVAASNIGSSGGETIQARSALIIEAVVPGDSHPEATISKLGRAIKQPGNSVNTFNLGITNTGNVLLTQSAVVIIRDSDGHQVDKLTLRPNYGYVIPGGTLPLKSDAWTGDAWSGIFTAQAMVPLLTNGHPGKTLYSNVITLDYSNPWLTFLKVAAVIVVLVLLLLLIRMIVKRRRRSSAERDELAREARSRQAAVDRLRGLPS